MFDYAQEVDPSSHVSIGDWVSHFQQFFKLRFPVRDFRPRYRAAARRDRHCKERLILVERRPYIRSILFHGLNQLTVLPDKVSNILVAVSLKGAKTHAYTGPPIPIGLPRSNIFKF